MTSPELTSRILAQIDEEALVSMACDVISISSPTGAEMEMARYMQSAFSEMGLEVTWQEVEEGRANVIGSWLGSGSGKSLMFNGHTDTSYRGDEPHLTGIGYKPHPVIQDGMVFGLGIYNMKGALVCYTHALKALQAAGLRLSGDLHIAAVAGEIEKSQWGEEFSGSQFRGYGAGTHYLVNHGFCPDMCILGEPTDMKLVLGHFGSLWARVTTRGPFMHTGFSSGRQEENSIHRMRAVLDRIAAWIPQWEELAAYGGKKAVVNLGCVRGGQPWRASRLPERCDAFLDIRVPPTIGMAEAQRHFRGVVSRIRSEYPEFGIECEFFVTAPGAEIDPGHELVSTIEACHSQVLGTPPERDTVIWSSDASVLTRYGIETINYGPSSGLRKADGEKVAIDTLLNVTRVYALVAAAICGAEAA